MELDITKVQIKGDRVLVKKLAFEEKVGSFYVPESVRSRKEKRRADAWRAEVVAIGDRIDYEMLNGTLAKGDVLFLAPVSLDCPAFVNDKNEHFVVITQDDILAKETK